MNENSRVEHDDVRVHPRAQHAAWRASPRKPRVHQDPVTAPGDSCGHIPFLLAGSRRVAHIRGRDYSRIAAEGAH